jgi:hypothetical protein
MATPASPEGRLIIGHRFRGPPRSGNGGYTCGLLAGPLTGAVAARLRAPPPLEVPLRLAIGEGTTQLLDGEQLVGEARRAPLELAVPDAPGLPAAAESSHRYAGLRHHPFPGCFVCGPGREPDDGLRIFPGPITGTDRVAAPWTPDPSLAGDDGAVRPEFLWAALDCTGGFAVWPDLDHVAIVLGELVARLEEPAARPGDPCIVLGWPLGREGRKRYAGSAVFTASGRLLGRARATWIEVPREAWR